MVLANNGPGLVVYGVAFYELEPPYLCSYSVPQFVHHEPANINEAYQSPVADPFERGLGSQFEYVVPCNSTVVCATGDDQDTSLISYKIDESSIRYIQNWIEQLNIQCAPSEYIGLLGAMAFLGAALSCFFAPALGDKYGRWIVWFVTITCQLPIYFGANLTDHIGVVYVMCFYLGMGLIGRFACGFILFTEIVPKKY